MKKPVSHYDILKVSPRAGDEDIRRAYRMMAMKYHPDKNPHNRPFYEQRFRRIQEAYNALKTMEKRRLYNRTVPAINDNVPFSARQGNGSWLGRLMQSFGYDNNNTSSSESQKQ